MSEWLRQMVISESDVCGLILAGGEGRRMQGKDKGLILLNDKPLTEYAYEVLSPVTSDLRISCNRNKEHYSAYANIVQDDERWQYSGPMAGIHAGLTATDKEWLMVMPCDTPFMNSDIMSKLRNIPDNAVAHIFSCDGWQPLHGMYHRSLIPLLEQQLESGKTGLQYFLRKLNSSERAYVTELEYPVYSRYFSNTNSPDELESVAGEIRRNSE